MNPFVDMFRFTPNECRYYRKTVAPMLAFVTLMALSALIVRLFREDWPFAALALVTMSPTLGMAWFMKVYIDYFRACDEWERLIEVYGICIAVLIVGMVYFALGLLGLMELVVLDGTWMAYGMLPAVSLVYSLGKVIGRWRHG